MGRKGFRWRWLVVVLGTVVIFTFGFWVVESEGWRDVKPTESGSIEAEVIAAAVAQIDAESEGTLRSHKLGSAPISKQPTKPTEHQSTNSPDAPRGYAFVEFSGEMNKRTIERRERFETSFDDGGFEWLSSPGSIDTFLSQATASDRDWMFGWIRMNEHATFDEVAQAVHAYGVEIVGTSGRMIRSKLPTDKASLRSIFDMPEVVGIGAPSPEVKLHAVTQASSTIPFGDRIPVFVTLMIGDRNGVWGRELESLGAVVGRYDPTIRVYAVNATMQILEAIARADFVMTIEPVRIVKASHDTAVPAMGADALRNYLGSRGRFSGVGGASVPIAVMDSGLNINHVDIFSNRESICGANFVYYDQIVDDEDLWIDAGIHGTHVTGTIVGNGTSDPRYAGIAPSVEHIRFAKVLSHRGFGSGIFILRGMDYLADSIACPEAGWSSIPVKPLIVNMSLSASARVWDGRSISERKLDAVVWDQKQLYVVAQSNEDIHGFSNYASAKNSLAVGAVRDSGEIVSFSSHGPTADGRLAPQIVGTGVSINSAAGDGSRGGYLSLSGTSMASPAVAGVATLLMDAVPSHRERPALVRARLMASAIKPDVWLEKATSYQINNSNGPWETTNPIWAWKSVGAHERTKPRPF